MKPPRATSADVARLAGVSRATVSYVLNDAPHQTIPEATRQRVLAAAHELEYTPHAAARALRAGASQLVLLVNAGVPYGTNLSTLIDALDAEVAAGGRSLVVWQQRDPADLPATLAHLQPVVTISLGRLTADQRGVLDRVGIPHVETAAESSAGSESLDFGAVLQVRHLADRGHRRLGYLTTDEPKLAMFARARVNGVQTACAELGLPAARVTALEAPEAVPIADLATTLRSWTGAAEPVTAIACYNDVYAAAGLAAADAAGIAVPDALAVVGMDDEPTSRFTRPPLTTVRLHMAEYARHLWARAAALLTGGAPPAGSAGVHVSLMVRRST